MHPPYNAPSFLWGWHRVTSLFCHVTHSSMQGTHNCIMYSCIHNMHAETKGGKTNGIIWPVRPVLSPSAMISSTVTWCRPTVKALPMKFPPAWLEPELPPPPPEPGPELTNSRRESKNFLMVSKRQEANLWLQYHRRTARFLSTDLLHW